MQTTSAQYAGTMAALRLHAIGGPQQVRIDEVSVPRPVAGDVLVRIRAAALNHRDLFICQGLYPGIVLPRILGSDGAGEIAAVGSDVTSLKIGDSVAIDPMLHWGDDPLVWNGRESSILGMPRDGTFAQFVTVPAANAYAVPAHLSSEQAAALPLAGLTAYRALFTRGQLRAGETVLVTGVGGGVQTFVLLFAKHAGARVIVTSGSDAKLERAIALGADVALDYRENDWVKRARAAGPIHLAIDSSGGATLAAALDALSPGGRIVIYGGTNGDASIKIFPLFWKHLTILGTSMGSPQDFAAMLAFVDRTHLKPAIDRVYPLSEGADALQRMAFAQQFGKIVLSVP